jgi:hypothetical protein
MGKLPWIIYQALSSLLKKGGWPLVLVVSGLVVKGVLSSYEDIKKYANEWMGDSTKTGETASSESEDS